jgi:tetratricopeptide (TPR) repeat protein
LAALALLALSAGGAGLAGIHLWAMYHFRAGRAAVERCHNREAQRHLNACLRVWPHNPDTLILAARTARRMGAMTEADSFLDACHGLKGDDDLALERLLLQAARGEGDRVQKVCLAMVKDNHPATPLILEALAYGYITMYRLQEASFALTVWMDRQPDSPQAYLLRGILYTYADRVDDALADFRHVLELDPEHDEVRLRLASALLDRGQGAEALPHFEYLRQRMPDELTVQVGLARCKDLLGQQAEAAQLLDEVLSRRPDYADALAERGKVAMRAGDLDAAETWLRKAAILEPGDYQLHYQIHLCLTQNGKEEEAREEEQRLKQIDADLKRIRQIVTHDMGLAPHDPALHYEAGMIALRTGEYREAVRWFESALREDPKYVPAHLALAQFYAQVGEAAKAAQHRDQARQAEAGKPTADNPGADKPGAASSVPGPAPTPQR